MAEAQEASNAAAMTRVDAIPVKRLRLEQRQLKATLTRFETLLGDNPDPVVVAQRLPRVERALGAFEAAQREIGALEDVPDDGESEVAAFEERYDNLLIRAARLIRPASVPASETSTAVAESALSTNGAGFSGASPYLSTNLPAISVPTFSGNHLEWETFRDMFVSLVHSNVRLSNVQRFHYLKSNLLGEAAVLVENYAITEANYAEAWRELHERYGNKRILLNNHWRAFSTLAPVTKESAAALKHLFGGIARMDHALNSLDRAASAWEDWRVYFAVERLDATTRRDWERSLGKCPVPPSFEALKSFVEGRIQALESFSSPSLKRSAPTGMAPQTAKAHHAGTTSSGFGCAHCKGAHYVGYCQKMRALSVPQRRALVAQLRLCFNCLRSGHRREACPSGSVCSTCHEKHHSILHDAASKPSSREADQASPPLVDHASDSSVTEGRALVHHAAPAAASHVLLATAVVRLRSTDGRSAEVRALLDPGAEISFISEATVQSLRLRRERAGVSLVGVGGSALGGGTHVTTVECESLHDPDFLATIRACILTRVANPLPSNAIGRHDWPHLSDLVPLADPGYARTARIDLILGADVYGSLLMPDVRQGPPGSPTAQLTRLGWTIVGPVNDGTTGERRRRLTIRAACHATVTSDLPTLLQMFWEVEEVPAHASLSPVDEVCEEPYVTTHTRKPDGRYVVRLPLRDPAVPDYSSSLGIAVSCLFRLERRCAANPCYGEKYARFLAEYEQLGHMQLIDQDQPSAAATPYYLPHHGVLRGDEEDGKLRVVFNASQRTLLGDSLNENLLVGPSLQQDLFSVVLRWRRHAVVLTADVEKMYRQILMDDRDADLQRIVWRSDALEPIQHFRLSTVTYGTACAPYLAIRTLFQLAADEQHRFPRAAEIVRTQAYVDDFLFGADNVTSALHLREELIALLRAGGFELRKWSSNRTELLAELPAEWLQTSPNRSFDDDRIKALGLEWSPCRDSFFFQVSPPATSSPPTKRSILSMIARLFDPMGWLAPVIVTGKILMQELWLTGTDWDTPLSGQLAASWEAYCAELPALESVTIPRWIGCSDVEEGLELHGFADASSRAYAAAVYLRAPGNSGPVVSLLAAKSKVAPIKQLSIPRLELCGAALLVRLVTLVRSALALPNVTIYLWSDSRVVLAWLKAHPTRWTTFVANRVSAIQTALPDARWRHVPTKDNPADAATRGVAPAALPELSLWWSGPQWLAKESSQWPLCAESDDTELEARPSVKAVHLTAATPVWDLASRISSATRLWRVTAWCIRFVTNCRVPGTRSHGPLTSDELHAARLRCIKSAQADAFADDIAALSDGKELPRHGAFRGLRPFVDTTGVLRVGGRLQRSSLEYEGKHPVILPRRSALSNLLIAEAHLRVLHGGTQLTLSHLMTQYWILGCRALVRAHIHRCVKCVRQRADAVTPVMGNLPSARVISGRPFRRAGVDYAGPIQVRTTKGRGHRSTKGYIALFVCLWSKAIHLEVVSDCSTSAFVAAFQRFTSRRGQCVELVSDNGTTFHGADSELRRMFQEASAFRQDIAALIANDGTGWSFIPPSAPHFGGLWEAGVRSTKHHLRRVIGDSTLTYEELSTVLAQIEACLNSRPLTPLSSDPSDFAALTPGHFLIGEPLLAVPEPSSLEVPLNRLSRWQLLSNMRDHFWRRWSAEYLHQLQQRTKWSSLGEQLQVGRLVLLKDERLPPTKWLMGRVVATHPGADGAVRVVSVRTATSAFKRPVVKLCPLPDCEAQSVPPV